MVKRKRSTPSADQAESSTAQNQSDSAGPEPDSSALAKEAGQPETSSSSTKRRRRSRSSAQGRNSSSTQSANSEGSAKTNELIAQLHTLRKQAAVSDDPKLQKQLLAKEKALGGLSAYQDASVAGSQAGGETSKWLVKTLISLLPTNRHQLKKQVLVDVGAISGTAYAKWPMMKAFSIDLNPRADSVLKWDWLELVPQDLKLEPNTLDIVALSLVLNFQGELEKRADMILHSHLFLKPEGKLYIVLPLACLNNSRYLTHKHFKSMLRSFGFGAVLKQHDSAKLSYWLLQRDGAEAGWDGQTFKKAEIRAGVKRNNFAIVKK